MDREYVYKTNANYDVVPCVKLCTIIPMNLRYVLCNNNKTHIYAANKLGCTLVESHCSSLCLVVDYDKNKS